jgi:urease accessory protein
MPFAAAVFDSPETFENVDEELDAFTTNHVANRASRAQGRAFLTTSERAFRQQSLTDLRSQVIARELPAHFSTAFGFVLNALNFDRSASLRLLLHNQLRGVLSSAVRLNIVGPLDAQALQAELAESSERVLASCRDIPIASAVQQAPVVDLFQATQDRLYSRLFQS